MYQYKAESLWSICLNCEHEYAFEEIFSEEEEDMECPFCSSKEFRQCDSFGLDIDGYTKRVDYDEWR